MPTGPTIRDHSDGSISVEYHPQQQGRHEVLMNYDGSSIDGSPFSCIVDNVNGSFITAYGSGLIGGLCGSKALFTIVSKKGSQGDLDVAIGGPSKVEFDRKDNPDGSTIISYMPMAPGALSISITFKKQHIKGSPFSARASGEGRKRSHLSMGQSSEYNLKVTEVDVLNLYGSIKTPSSLSEPCTLKRLQHGELGVSAFTPKQKGAYAVSVFNGDKHISHSPFTINVGDKELAHAAKVQLSGKALKDAMSNEDNDIVINAAAAGYGSLSVSIDGEHRSEVKCTSYENSVFHITYSPHEPGIYIMNIRYADEHTPGSPFLINCGGKPSGRIRETLTRQIQNADPVDTGSHCELLLHIPGTNPFEMEASITDPEGATELCEVMSLEDAHYNIKFIPKMKGGHVLSVKHKTMHVSGSPFHYTVGQLSAGGAHKVAVGGPGIEKGEVGIKRHYGIHVKHNDIHIPGSPFPLDVTPDSGLVKHVTLSGLRDRGLQRNKPATFSVSYNGATGTLHATVFAPSGSHEDCFIEEMDREVYAVRFIPKENGVHYVQVKLNEYHIPDSPFAMMVGSTAADPAMIHAHGDGLESGKTGAKNKFVVRTINAGSGVLNVSIEGPSKAAISCKEVDEGYEFSYSVFCPGDYLISIKYGNISLAGSPYRSTVTGTGRKPFPTNEQTSMIVETIDKKGQAVAALKKFRGDASKVLAKGNALKKAFTNKLVNITLDIKDAGHAMLSVGMMSAKGEPVTELSVKKTTQTVYTVSYKVANTGAYTLSIKWGDEDVTGSPFSIST